MILAMSHYQSIQRKIFKNYSTNKQHKVIKKGSKGMDFHNYANRIKCLKNFDTFEQPINECKKVGRFMVKKGEMVTTSVMKTKFSQIIFQTAYGHPSLTKIHDFKTERGQKIK